MRLNFRNQENLTSASPSPATRPRGVLGALLTLGAFTCWAAVPQSNNFADLSFEELANIEITSVSKKTERLADAPASVYVITNEEIRRYGATRLPEVLRLAPNLQVAQITSNNYAINARGFNTTTSDKLLVLIDGRTVYTPLYSGVFWDSQDLVLEDIERIEVISGPGGTLWGTNAVNGVINIITRNARHTQGTHLVLGGGNREQVGLLRFGAPLGARGHYRIYGKYADRDHTTTASGNAVRDTGETAQAGFRADWNGTQDQFTVQGDVFSGRLDQVTLPATAKITNSNVMASWDRKQEDGASSKLSAYYDQTERNFPGSYHQTLEIFDLQFQHSLPAMGAHALIWGASYRRGSDRMNNGTTLAFLPASLNQTWSSLFAQDAIALRDDLQLTLGARLERNDYTGLEMLPNARLAWKLPDDRLLWGSIARAVRSPSRIDRDFFAPALPPYQLMGNTTFVSEVAKVVEFGYRAKASAILTYSATAFHASYDRLRSVERTPGGVLFIGNRMQGSNSGIETWGTYQATSTWRLSAGLTAQRVRLRLEPGSTDTFGTRAVGNDPRHFWQLRSAWQFAPAASLDLGARHVGALPNPKVPSYTALDARLAWKLRNGLELSLIGQNLFGGKHPEFGALPNRSEIAPRVFLKLLWNL